MDGIEIRRLGAGDRAVLDDVDPDAFDGPVVRRWAEAVLSAPNHHLVVALDGTRVVGMASAVHFAQPDKAPVLYVDEVGTADAYRRRGVASALMDAVLGHARTLGCTEAWLLTEADNAPARAFYAATGWREEPGRPVHFTFPLRPEAG